MDPTKFQNTVGDFKIPDDRSVEGTVEIWNKKLLEAIDRVPLPCFFTIRWTLSLLQSDVT